MANPTVRGIQQLGKNSIQTHRDTKHVYYESIKRKLKIRPIYECRFDERLQTKAKESTRLTYTGFLGGLEHLKIETRLIDEKIVNALGEYVT